jgi:Protein of unknown function (DUF5131)/Histidine kinase-, DNA gyrase B-, and HSP90-like ATPase
MMCFGTEKALEPLRRVNAAGTHLLSLINEILDLSKIEAGKLELNLEPVNLARLIDEVIGTAGQLAEKNQNRLIVEAQENVGALTADSTRLKQILLNLLSNACKFTKEGEIALRVCKVTDGRNWVELAVADTGIGLTAEQQAKRPQNIARMLPADWGLGYANVWIGTTTEDAERFRIRWPILSRIPAARRFISYEPAIAPLGAIDIGTADCLPDWVICGGESGGRARVMHPAWARHARDQCHALSIAFLHKQWGTYRSNPLVQEQGLSRAEAERQDPPTNGKGGALLDGRLHREFPGEWRAVVSARTRGAGAKA